MRVQTGVGVIGVAIGAAWALVVSSVAVGARQPDPSAAIFTVEQASAGKAGYARSCASCHLADLSGNNDAPPLAGAGFMSAWGTRTTKELFDYTTASMPPGDALTADAYLSIMAYVLHVNGAPAGSTAYTSSTAVPIASLVR